MRSEEQVRPAEQVQDHVAPVRQDDRNTLGPRRHEDQVPRLQDVQSVQDVRGPGQEAVDVCLGAWSGGCEEKDVQGSGCRDDGHDAVQIVCCHDDARSSHPVLRERAGVCCSGV